MEASVKPAFAKPPFANNQCLWDTAYQSFWLADLLRYFYLISSEPELISLDDYVFDTEAHPLRLSQPSETPVMNKNLFAPLL
ncbi:glycoside hydrolase family 47 protein [Thermothielavioides terrestris NRRL 8126]|uniref:Glycoside hydrolase family 47 protein n=1 Tax=Thermothielavioides terrestris (strain ATCC 38088 / NRRL 8126) TaxID=578455 RepID=G2R3C5_THETT|nr:glycoside hydrolase family 47 protein [Thermothielavioides terrestris NRRL 8126]AEO65936.1 glycoside hydrolase family 47 protein [Thermothielavioides terrestris NRRL 8126]